MSATATSPRRQVTSGVRLSRLSLFASVKLTVLLLSLIAATVLVGAWCPQEAQVGQEKVVEAFGEDMALTLSRLGITDIFHTPWFLLLIGLLTVNMVCCSVQRVFPKLRSLNQPLPLLGEKEIGRLPQGHRLELGRDALQSIGHLERLLRSSGYRVNRSGLKLTAESGKFGRLAPTVTHIGLLTLLVGVTISSWTGFSGFKPVPLNGRLSFQDSTHSKLWIGRLPDWTVRVDATRREDYQTGEPKQWYSSLSVIDKRGQVVKSGEISVNNPLSYQGVDIYQSSWGLDHINLSFNHHHQRLALRPMGKLYAAFLPLAPGTVLIFSVRDQVRPLRVFGKTEALPAPRLLAEIPPRGSIRLGDVRLQYERVVPVTGLQYKDDPGYPVTFIAFCFIITGVLLAAVPHRMVWGCATEVDPRQATTDPSGSCILSLGGRALKGKSGFEKSMRRLCQKLESAQEMKEKVKAYV